LPSASPPLRYAHLYEPAVGTRDRALHDQEVVFRAHLDHLEAQRRDALVAVLTGHALALVDASWELPLTDRSGVAVLLLGAVGRGHAREVPALHDAGGAAALGRCGDVDLLAGREGLDGDVLTVGLEVAKLDEVPLRPHAGLLEVPGERLVHRLLLLLEPAELDGGVAVRGRCLALHHGARTGQQDRDRNEPVALPDLGHAHFGAEDAFHSYRPPTVLISISTPVGRSRCIRESMVLLVGDLMSISLLCVRISKCSRLSLSTNGPRSTQNRRMRVG